MPYTIKSCGLIFNCRCKILLKRRTAWIVVVTITTVLAVGNSFVFFMFELQIPLNETKTLCYVPNPRYHFAANVLIPWIDIAIYSVIPTIFIACGNIAILWKVLKSRVERKQLMMQNIPDRMNDYKMIPMLILLSLFFMVTTIPICIYYIGKL